MLLLMNPRGTCRCGRKNDWLHIRRHVGFFVGELGPPLPSFFSSLVVRPFLMCGFFSTRTIFFGRNRLGSVFLHLMSENSLGLSQFFGSSHKKSGFGSVGKTQKIVPTYK